MTTPAQPNPESVLRQVEYVRHEFHGEPEPMRNSLLAFVYDIPYFGACGVFPPFHLLNQMLRRGGSQGGMSPGATWEPFELSDAEYRQLVAAVMAIPPESLRARARYAHVQFVFDPEFDGDRASYPIHPGTHKQHQVPPELDEYVAWLSAVCGKHRSRHHAELRRAGFMK